MVKTRRQQAEETVNSGDELVDLASPNKEPEPKRRREEEIINLPPPGVNPFIDIQDGELEILEGEEENDDENSISELAIGQVVSPDFLMERLLILKSKVIDNLFTGNYAGIECRFNIDGSNSQKLRGLILLEIVIYTESLIQNKEFSAYRDLFYRVESTLTDFSTHIAKLWPQFRPNIRLIERKLKVPIYSLPYFGRPNGFLALGDTVHLAIGNHRVGSSGDLSRIPFGNYNMQGQGTFNSNAKLIVVIESHGELRHAISRGVLTKAKETILLTGCGNPDLSMRAIISKLSADLKIPVKFLVDCDLHGFMIAAQLAFGSFSFNFKDSLKYLTPQISPIGIIPSQILDSDKYVTELTTAEDSAINVLRNKWRAHGLELTQSQQFWEDICLGFEEIGKKMSLCQIRLNRGENFNVDQIVAAEAGAVAQV